MGLGLRGFYRRQRQRLRQRLVADPHFQAFGVCHARVRTGRKAVALTYDDGPLEPYTGQLLEVLGRHGVKATFFATGQQLEAFPESACRILAEGHVLGNHSYSHPHMVGMPLAAMREEILRTNALLRGLGVEGEIFFRAPYGEKGLGLPYLLSRLGMRHILFDFFPEPPDWRGTAPEVVAANLLERLRPGSILVLHDGNPKAGPHVAAATDLLLEGLGERGYQALSVPELLQCRWRP